ncbi:MAG: bifunctional phosphopantothenoylcysteine decarboxylase/phosphopantothenate--cysteine ligase CoaBC [Bryobacteraceae bacterium]|nr:bifunctional phosphopantothenoylcysteine decarboxylase/phosphopantothenate--cysteine ligase CoaBC [Bryobacterales bacterium]MEB2361836.1 bifunctional phosphopantothenoylcysteine decarboxylase/phosphopantothenate--cysteine ligase CoaBC [Bryobacterales bacterium]NUN00955.1 bifunctional phosphopantothenoylcysteine decarboxylase/phosphopantothenate--cysteine ligase CoaBC [Bryobacteraceae bacterium]
MNIILGVSGGIAAYKSAELARAFMERGHAVQVVMTAAAEEFIQPLTFAALTGRKVITSLFGSRTSEEVLSSSVEHVRVAQEGDVLVVAPATANVLAKFAHGLADDFLSTLYLAFEGRVVLAPAMNTNMWRHAATIRNLEALRARGHTIIEPEEGMLACGTIGPGRLADVEKICDAALTAPLRDLEAETILITAGPTQEPLDPVRYISNRSSGKMGFALAAAAVARGARVILISGPVHLDTPRGAELVRVRTAVEMRDAVMKHLAESTIIVKSAAVADYHAANVSGQKLKKKAERLSLELDPTPDILAELGQKKGGRLLIGFAAETQRLLEEARRKLKSKNCDMIAANLVGQDNTGFESDENEVVLALSTGEAINIPRGSKRAVAERIFDEALRLRLALHAVR